MRLPSECGSVPLIRHVGCPFGRRAQLLDLGLAGAFDSGAFAPATWIRLLQFQSAVAAAAAVCAGVADAVGGEVAVVLEELVAPVKELCGFGILCSAGCAGGGEERQLSLSAVRASWMAARAPPVCEMPKLERAPAIAAAWVLAQTMRTPVTSSLNLLDPS